MTFGALQLVLVALGGAAGGLARFWLTAAVARRVGDAFPWGTLAVNASGALLIGLFAGAVLTGDGTTDIPDRWALLVVGVLGSYTTVSAFSLQTLLLVARGAWGRAGLNVALSVCLCLAAAAAGFGLIRLVA